MTGTASNTPPQRLCDPLARGLKSPAGVRAVTHEALYRAVATLEKPGAIARASESIRLLKRSVS